MNNLRYGKIRLDDYLPSIGLTICPLLIGIVALTAGANFEAGVFFTATVLALLNILSPCLECFSIRGNIITTRGLFHSSKKSIPSKSVLIITQADVHEVIGQQSVLLKGRYAVSILRSTPLDTVLKILHGKYPSQFLYTNSTIQRSFDEHIFIYSFVFDEELLACVLKNTECLMVIPESIKKCVVIDNMSVEVYIDLNY